MPCFGSIEDRRAALAASFGVLVRDFGYTCYACAILKNHAHLVIRRHRDDGYVIGQTLASGSAAFLRERDLVPTEHAVWATRVYAVFLHTPKDVRSRVTYVENNPIKEGLGAQRFPFVRAYDGWPYVRGLE